MRTRLLTGVLALGAVALLRLGCGGAPSESAVPAAAPAPPPVAEVPAAPVAATDSAAASTPAVAPPAPTEGGGAPESPSMGTEAPAEPRVTLLISSEQLGELEPCGCAEGQYGGLPRRASLLHSYKTRGRHVIIADNGDIVQDGALQSQYKFDTTMQVHQILGTVAVNLGERELLLDPQAVTLTAMNYAVPLVSANVAPVDQTHVVVPVDTGAGVVRVGFTGFLDPEAVEQARPGWQVAAPAPALRPVLEELSRSADVTVVLAQASLARTEAVFADLPAPDLFVVAKESEDPLEPVPTVLRGVPALAPGTQAKYLASATITLAGSTPVVQAGYVGLSELIPDDPVVRNILDTYQEILKTEHVADQATRRPYAAGGTYVGPQVCKTCHRGAYQVWTTARHAHSMDPIVAKNHEFDPDCLVCHTTGFSYKGGYESREETPQLAFVSCESCHGPASAHVEAARTKLSGGPGADEIVLAGYGEVRTPDHCMTCHDEPNSPKFDFVTYWPKIQHGGDLTK